jgi:hypothetical protein
LPDGTTQLADLVPGAPRVRRPEPPAPRKPQAIVPPVALAPRPAPTADEQPATTPDESPQVVAQAVHAAAPVVEMRALGQRIREPFYSQLTALVYELDRRRIRTNKTEVLEFLLAGLPADDVALDVFAGEIGRFRQDHPRAS